MSIAITASILGAQAIGAGRVDRLAKTMRAGQTINLLLTGAGIVLVYLFSRQIIGLFVTDADTANLTVNLLHIVVWSILFFGAAGVFGLTGPLYRDRSLPIAATRAARKRRGTRRQSKRKRSELRGRPGSRALTPQMSGQIGIQALCFGDFHLCQQMKVTRPPGRDPATRKLYVS
jgi:hypothetical protein